MARNPAAHRQRSDPRQPHLAAVRVPGHQQIGPDSPQGEVRHVTRNQMEALRVGVAQSQLNVVGTEQTQTTEPQAGNLELFVGINHVDVQPVEHLPPTAPIDVTLHGENAKRRGEVDFPQVGVILFGQFALPFP